MLKCVLSLIISSALAWSAHGVQLPIPGLWQPPAISADGSKIYIPTFPDSILGSPPGYYHSSYDTGNTWVRQAGSGNRFWVVGCASSDGTIVYGADQSSNGLGSIWKSIDSGVTWAQTNSPLKAWQQVSCSSDGTKLVGCIGSQGAQDDLFTSIDGGVTWVDQTGSLTRNWLFCVISGDGAKIAATNWLAHGPNGDGKVYISTNWQSGSPVWTGSNASANGSTFATPNYSRDGSTLYAAYNANGSTSHIYKTTDNGANWIDVNPPGGTTNQRNWGWVACSANGQRVVASTLGPRTAFVSNDFGATWTAFNPQPYGPAGWQASFLAVSDNGLVIVNAGYAGYVSVSTDGGAHFNVTQAVN
jgi:hypothetical protein